MLFDAFPGFGPNRYDPARSKPELHEVRGRRPQDLRAGVREHAPKTPGVYGMIDPRGRLHYVGKAKNLRSRLLSYFRVNSRDPKAARIVNQSWATVWEPAPSEFAALLRELELIRQFCPPHNVVGQPGRRRFTYLHLGRKPAPYFYRRPELSSQAIATYGPLPGGRRLGDAVRRLNDLFRLRDCPQTTPLKFADQPELFPISEPAACLRYEINKCLGPCVAAVTKRQYAAGVRAARAFLDGHDMQTLLGLRQSMNDAAKAEQFERAAMLRDIVDDLFWLQERLAWLQNARQEYSFVYPTCGVWYFIRGGRVLASTIAPTHQRSRRSALRTLDAVFPPGGGPSIIPNDVYDHVMLVTGWFRRRPDERAAVLSPDQARAQCGSLAAVA